MVPVSVLGSAGVAAIKAVLAAETQICAVGGVSHNDFANTMAANIQGVGLGSSLYRLDEGTLQIVQAKAAAAIAAYDSACQR